MRLRNLALCTALLTVTPASEVFASIEILTPQDATVLTWMPVPVSLDFDETADIPTLQVLLNGTDVTALFQLAAPSGGRTVASASHVWEGAVIQGSNTIAASIEIAGVLHSDSVVFETAGDPFADAVVRYLPGANGGFNAGSLPEIALGAPVGDGLYLGGLDVVSLGLGGSIDLEFVDNVVVDGPGADFALFENAFLEVGAGSVTQFPFAEPGRVLVSQNGIDWVPFVCELSLNAAPYWPGCAGVYPVLSDGSAATPHASIPTTTPIEALVGVSVFSLELPAGSGGDRFDLADLGLTWVRYVRIEAADFDTEQAGVGNSAFDLDAIAALHSAPSIPAALPVPAVDPFGCALLVIALAGLGARCVGAGVATGEVSS